MRISRKKRPIKPLIPQFNVNGRIRAEEVRVISQDNQNLGVLSLDEARRLAEEAELDLVEINPKATPPVVQILDFSAFKYQKEKEARKQKVNSHVSDIKGIRLSVRIGEHDLDIRRKQTEKFLNQGDKVKVEIILRGRENARQELGFETITDFIRSVEAIMPLRIEQSAQRQANKITAIIAKK